MYFRLFYQYIFVKQSRSKLEDPEQLKLKQKAKEMQRAEMEEARQREANETALLAIGSRKKVKLDSMGGFAAPSLSGTTSSFNQTNSNHFSNSIFSTPSSKLPVSFVFHFLFKISNSLFSYLDSKDEASQP